jgi:hypothetical protein
MPQNIHFGRLPIWSCPPVQLSTGTSIAWDTFTDVTGTLLSAHTADSGATWNGPLSSMSGTAVITSADRLRGVSTTADGCYTTSAGTPSANCTVSCNIFAYTLSNHDFTDGVGLCARMTSAGNGYVAFYQPSYDEWFLGYLTGGTFTGLGAPYPQSINTGQIYQIALQVTNNTIALIVGGTVAISVSDYTYTAAGHAGVYFQSAHLTPTDTTGIQIDNWQLWTGPAPPSAWFPMPHVCFNETIEPQYED